MLIFSRLVLLISLFCNIYHIPTVADRSISTSSSPTVYIPGELSPTFSLPLLNINGSRILTRVDFNPSSIDQLLYLPLVIWVVDFSDEWQKAALMGRSSLDMFLLHKSKYDSRKNRFSWDTGNSSYLFIARKHIDDLYAFIDRIRSRAFELKVDEELLMERFLFANITLTTLLSSGNSIGSILAQWESSVARLSISYRTQNNQSATYNISRLDCYWPYCGSSTSSAAQLVYIDDGCNLDLKYLQEQRSLTGKYVLINNTNSFNETTCTYEKAAQNVGLAGGKAAIVVMNDSDVSVQINRNANYELEIFVTSVSYEDGMKLKSILLGNSSEVFGSFFSETIPGNFLVIDTDGRLQELGSSINADLMIAAWATQYEVYLQQLELMLQKPAFVVPVFYDHVMDVTSSQIEISRSMLRLFSKMEIDTAITCPGNFDTGYGNCTRWDHCVTLTVSCAMDHRVSPSEVGGSKNEIARYITPFSRRIGHWLTDVTLMMPLLTSSNCDSFVFEATAGGYPWIISSSLRFTALEDAPPANNYRTLYSGSRYFDEQYNSNDRVIVVELSSNVQTVYLEAIITGHGYDDYGCCEFLPTNHVFTVNNVDYNLTFWDAGTAWGCADMAIIGSEPNEYGTWWYGRGGWCDGMDVKPWVVDVTDAVISSDNLGKNSTATIRYRAEMFFNGTWMDPQPGQSGYIIISSHLVYYTSPDSSNSDSLEQVDVGPSADVILLLVLIAVPMCAVFSLCLHAWKIIKKCARYPQFLPVNAEDNISSHSRTQINPIISISNT